MIAIKPSVEAVEEALACFRKDNGEDEDVLADLFRRHPENSNYQHVLLKVVVVNSLYATNVFAFRQLAKHIHGVSRQLDPLIKTGDLAAFALIEHFKIEGRPDRSCFSFASKFLSWHAPEVYPIYDSRAEAYLWALIKQENMDFKREELWKYRSFRTVIDKIRAAYSLESYSYKQLDAFFYQQGMQSNRH